MQLNKLIYLICSLILIVGAAPAQAATIDFAGSAHISVSLNPAKPYSLLDYHENIAEIGNYLAYPHGNKVIVDYNKGYGSASISGSGMSASNNYASGTFHTQGALQVNVNGFVSQYNENRMNLFVNVDSRGLYDFNINVDSWERSYGWDQTSGNPLTEAGWYSNLYVKLVQNDTILREANLVLVNDWTTAFSPTVFHDSATGGADSSLSLLNVQLDPGQYTLYLADYMTQYGVNPPTVPVPGSLLLLGSGLVVLASWKLK